MAVWMNVNVPSLLHGGLGIQEGKTGICRFESDIGSSKRRSGVKSPQALDWLLPWYDHRKMKMAGIEGDVWRV